MPIFGQKTSILSKLQYFMSHKSQCPFFPIFHEKVAALIPIFYQKYVYSLKIKNKLLSSPCFVKKTSIHSKTLCSHVICFQVFYEKPPAAKLIFGQKNVNSVKITLYFGSKKSIGCPYFLIFTGK